jgi:citronellyl-CoA dehydrogenase
MQFTQEHDAIRRTMQQFIKNEINPFVDEWERAAIYPAHQVFKKMGDLGLLGLCKPVEYGGADEVMLSVLCKYMGTLPEQ